MNWLLFTICLLSTNAFALNATVVEVIDGNTIKVLDSTNLARTINLADKDAPITNQVANENSKKGLISLILGKNVSIKENGKDEKGLILGQVFLDGLDVNKATRQVSNPPKPTVAETPIIEQPKQVPPQTTQLTEPPKPATPPVSKQSPPIQQKVEQKQIIEQPEVEEKTVEKKKIIKKSYSSSHVENDSLQYRESKKDIKNQQNNIIINQQIINTKPSSETQQKSKILKGKVTKIIDGDTIYITDENQKEYKIRLSDIDAPEKSQDFGQKSKQVLSSLAFGKNVSIQEKDIDKFGRIVGRVFVGNQDINLEMVKRGVAVHYKRYSHDTQMAIEEENAKKNKLGIWSHENNISPEEYRRQEKQSKKSKSSNSKEKKKKGKPCGKSHIAKDKTCHKDD